jgi:hypothetical protein
MNQMPDIAIGEILERYLDPKLQCFEIECPRCCVRCQMIDDCVYCGGQWMIPLSKISPRWLESEFVVASRGDRPEWMSNGLYHLRDQHTGDCDRWLVCEQGIYWISEPRYFGAIERMKSRREESAVVKMIKKLFGGE